MLNVRFWMLNWLQSTIYFVYWRCASNLTLRRKLKTTLRNIVQIIPILVFCCIGSYLFYFRIPGNHTFTDNDLVFSALLYGLFILFGIGLTLYSFFQIIKAHQVKLRRGVMIFTIGFLIVVLLPREFIVWTFLGEKKIEYNALKTNDSNYISVTLQLHENNSFVSSSSNFNLTEEKIGNYKLTDKSLCLTFENEKSKLIGTRFEITNDTMYCLDCDFEIKLLKQ